MISYFKRDVRINYFLDKIQNVPQHIGFSHTQKLSRHQSRKLESDLKWHALFLLPDNEQFFPWLSEHKWSGAISQFDNHVSVKFGKSA